MQARELGEFGLIERIERLARRVQGTGVVLGIGDDAALLRPGRGEDLAATCDAFVEGVHFRLETERPQRVGRRALVANLSDLAAMGARPLGAMLSLALPGSAPAAPVLAMVRGLLAEGRRHGCPLVGGNVTRAREISLHVSALGAVRRGRALRRDRARPGDLLYVTGSLGAAALDLARAEQGGGPRRHLPVPRLEAGRALSRAARVGACIDVSDGLAADLCHVIEASGVGAAVDVEALPRPRGFGAACRRLGVDARELLLGGGEDYELLFSIRPGGPGAAALSRRLGLPVTRVGRVTSRGSGPEGLPHTGWRHF